VALQADVQVKEETLALAQRLLEDNRTQVQQGTLAPVELARAEAQVTAAEQDLANSSGYELQQELLVKTVLTKKGTADPRIRETRILTTDSIEPPAQANDQPAEELVTEALRQRPEILQARLQVENSHISLEGSRNELLPALDLVAGAQNAGLAGQANPLAQTASGTGSASSTSASTPVAGSTANTGGISGSLGQAFSFRYPTYSVGVQLELPIRNRVAEADVVRDEYQLRQWQIRFQQLENQIRLEVEGALIALNQARQAYAAATRTRELQEQSLKIELEKYGVGLSTTFLVLNYQSMLAQAKSTEVASRDAYAKARIQLERAVGRTLEANGISFETAYRGQVKTPPQNR
jgi:outer membrane protein TolC